MTKRNKWTEEELEVLRTMYHAGEKHKDIARILNTAPIQPTLCCITYCQSEFVECSTQAGVIDFDYTI